MKLRKPAIVPAVAPRVINSAPIALFLGVSGAVALVYEIAWQRQFALIFGSAAPATAAVLGAYFAGLGLGAWVVGTRAHLWSRPLRAYAWLELFIGLGSLLVSPLLAVFESIYPQLFHLFSGEPNLFLAVRTSAAFAALLLPTFCMGGTLPLLGPLVDRGQKHLGRTAGWLYVVNTAGAAIGALAVPFILLPRFGLRHTVEGCAAINIILAVAAWTLDFRSAIQVVAAAEPPIKLKRNVSKAASPVTFNSVQTLALISGAVTFALQVLWNRAFAQIHENSMYSFAVVVAVTIAALAIGAQTARLGLRRQAAPQRLMAGAWFCAGILIIIGPWIFLNLSNQLAYLTTGEGWSAQAVHLTGLAVALLLVPMALLGVGLPALMEATGSGPGRDSARALGRLLSVNVIGSVLGSLVAGFLLPRWLGLWNSLIWLGVLLLGVGIWQWPKQLSLSARSKLGSAMIVIWLLSAWPISQLNLARVSVESVEGEQLVFLTEGTHGITAVVERPGSRRLKLNNHYGLGGTASTGDERMQAHIPLLLHPHPSHVAFLGLGTGITAGGALFHPIEQVTVMELVPDVITTARDYFRAANHAVIEDLHTRVVTDDARHSLRSSGEKYDVIVGDLVVPWRQGEGSLFTLEQFIAARRALAPGGLFCQWLPLFQLSETEVNILARTFLQVFPHAQVWRGDFSPTEPAIALIGAAEDLKFEPALLSRRLSEMHPDPTNPQLRSSENFWMNYIGNIDSSQLSSAETRLNLDDRPWVEMLGPMLHTGGSQGNIFTGRRLQKWLDQIHDHSSAEISALPQTEASAVEAGRALAEMTLCLSEGNQPGAKAAQLRLRQLLPEVAFRQLF